MADKANVRPSGKRGVTSHGRASVGPCPACCNPLDPCGDCAINCPPSQECLEACAACDECQEGCDQACNAFYAYMAACDWSCPPEEAPTYQACLDCEGSYGYGGSSCYQQCATCEECQNRQDEQAAYHYIVNGEVDLGTVDNPSLFTAVAMEEVADSFTVKFRMQVQSGEFPIVGAGHLRGQISMDSPEFGNFFASPEGGGFLDAGCDGEMSYTMEVPLQFGPYPKCTLFQLGLSQVKIGCSGGPPSPCTSFSPNVWNIGLAALSNAAGQGWVTVLSGTGLSVKPGGGVQCLGGAGTLASRRFIYRVHPGTTTPNRCFRVKLRHANLQGLCPHLLKALLNCNTPSEMDGGGGEGEFAEFTVRSADGFVDVPVGYYAEEMTEACCTDGAVPVSAWARWDIQAHVECLDEEGCLPCT